MLNIVSCKSRWTWKVEMDCEFRDGALDGGLERLKELGGRKKGIQLRSKAVGPVSLVIHRCTCFEPKLDYDRRRPARGAAVSKALHLYYHSYIFHIE